MSDRGDTKHGSGRDLSRDTESGEPQTKRQRVERALVDQVVLDAQHMIAEQGDGKDTRFARLLTDLKPHGMSVLLPMLDLYDQARLAPTSKRVASDVKSVARPWPDVLVLDVRLTATFAVPSRRAAMIQRLQTKGGKVTGLRVEHSNTLFRFLSGESTEEAIQLRTDTMIAILNALPAVQDLEFLPDPLRPPNRLDHFRSGPYWVPMLNMRPWRRLSLSFADAIGFVDMETDIGEWLGSAETKATDNLRSLCMTGEEAYWPGAMVQQIAKRPFASKLTELDIGFKGAIPPTFNALVATKAPLVRLSLHRGLVEARTRFATIAATWGSTLRELRLGSTNSIKVTNGNLLDLAGCTKLRALHLHCDDLVDNPLEAATWTKILAAMPELHTLILRGYAYKDADMLDAIVAAGNVGRWRRIQYGRYAPDPSAWAAAVRNMPLLEQVPEWESESKTAPPGQVWVNMFSHVPSLRTIHMAYYGVDNGSEGRLLLEDIPWAKLPRLQAIDVILESVHPDGDQVVKHIVLGKARLQHLQIGRLETCSDVALQTIGQACPELVTLALYIRDSTWRPTVELPTFSTVAIRALFDQCKQLRAIRLPGRLDGNEEDIMQHHPHRPHSIHVGNTLVSSKWTEYADQQEELVPLLFNKEHAAP